jgi:arylsulfatase A-like enzyme
MRMSCAAAVSYLDAGIGQLLENLDQLDPERQTVVIFTSDLGLPLGEHGRIGWPEAGPHEELLHVPLIVRLPGTARAGHRESEPCQHIDLAVMLADFFGVALPAAHGRAMLSLAGADQSINEVGVPSRPYLLSAVQQGGTIVWSLRTPDWSYVWPAPIEGAEPQPGRLFAQPEDPWEVNDVRQHHLELAEHFEQVLQVAVTASRQPGPLILPELRDEEDLLREGEAPAEPVEEGKEGA